MASRSPLSIETHGPANGTPVVFLHAFPLDRRMWKAQIAPLVAKGFRPVLVDLPGFGASPGRMTTLPDLAASLHDALATLPPFHLVGCSIGGYAALQYVLDHPDRVATLTLADARAEPDTPEGRTARDATIEAVKRRGMEPLAEAMLPKFFSGTTRHARPHLVEEVAANLRAQAPEAAIAALAAMRDRADQRPRLSEIRCPTLVVVGAEDQLTPVSSSQLLQRGIPGAQLRIVTGAAHLTPIEASEPFNHFIDHLVQGSLKPPTLGGHR